MINKIAVMDGKEDRNVDEEADKGPAGSLDEETDEDEGMSRT